MSCLNDTVIEHFNNDEGHTSGGKRAIQVTETRPLLEECLQTRACQAMGSGMTTGLVRIGPKESHA